MAIFFTLCVCPLKDTSKFKQEYGIFVAYKYHITGTVFSRDRNKSIPPTLVVGRRRHLVSQVHCIQVL